MLDKPIFSLDSISWICVNPSVFSALPYPPSWLPYSTYLYLGFYLFHDKAKRTQQGNLLRHDHHDRHHHCQHDHHDQVMLLLNQLALTGEKKMNLKEWLAMIGLKKEKEKKKKKKGKNDRPELSSHDEVSPPLYRNDWSQLHHHQSHIHDGVTGKYNCSF